MITSSLELMTSRANLKSFDLTNSLMFDSSGLSNTSVSYYLHLHPCFPYDKASYEYIPTPSHKALGIVR
jgi:hypothetical protein